MSHQCVPSWDLDEPLLHHPEDPHHHTPLPSSAATSAKYDVTELTWNGHFITTLGLGKPIPRRPPSSPSAAPPARNGGDGGGGGGTLECIVDQARSGGHHAAADAMVPCSDAGTNCTSQGSATATATAAAGKRKSAPSPPRPSAGDGEEEEGGGGGGGTPETENGSFAGGRKLAVEQRDSVSHTLGRSQRNEVGERGKTSVSPKRGREAAVHNQSERKRRDRINQKMKTLQKLLPNSSKTDKASMLDEVIEYLKLLQAQVQMMSRMSTIPTMMLPIAMQHQQLQLSMIAQMAQITRMGMSLGMIDPNLLNPAVPPLPILHPSTFLPPPSTAAGAWDARATEWMQQSAGRVLPDMFSAFMGGPAQQQPMSSEAYSRMATLYQQLYQQTLGSNQKT